MPVSQPLFWWILAGLLVLAELMSGTFFLLMLALGAAAGAIAAHLGLGLSAQMTVAAVAGGGAVFLWYLRRRHQPLPREVQSNPDALLDIGSRVQVDQWAADGSARVQYRGANWSARWVGEGLPEPGMHTIHRIDGSVLQLVR
ncbi:MAG: NfeD family protein [Candidatus Delongbacteria bacterium]|nr:NfeD family protein [Candidatus Delongbacteria bacterium]